MGDDTKLRYFEQGYVLWKCLLAPSEIEVIKEDIKRVFRGKEPRESDEAFQARLRRLFREDFPRYHGAAKLCNHLVSLHKLAVHESIQRALQILGVEFPVLCARPVVWFHSPHLAKTERYARLPAHQEWSNMQGSLDGIVVWAPLIDLQPEMGRLEVIAGSHRRGLLDFHPDPAKDYPLATNENLVEAERFTPVEASVGDVLFFSSFLVHRSGMNQTDRARLTINFRFNNASEPTFVERNFLNPFVYQVADRLITPGFPARQQVEEVFRHGGS